MTARGDEQLVVTEAFASENARERKELLQQIVDAYLAMRLGQ